VDSLWNRSGAWRWLVCTAVLLTGLVLLFPPWRTIPVPDPVLKQPAATFAPSGRPPVKTGGNVIVVPSAPGGVQPAPARTPATPRTLRYSVQDFSSPVTFRAERGMGEVSGGGLVAKYCCAGASSTVVATESVSSGRHYLEFELRTGAGVAPATWTDAGVAPVGTAGPQPAASASSGVPTAMGRGRRERFKSGDVFMFALDLENRLFFHGLNGEWKNGIPGESGGDPLGAGAPYVPFVNISAASSSGGADKDAWTANFGRTPFKYPIPAGFKAYGSRAAGPPVVQTATVITPSAAVVPTMAELRSSPGASPAAAPSAGPGGLLGKVFSDAVVVGGQRVPLTEGDWRVVAQQVGSQPAGAGELVILARVEGNRLEGLVAIHAFTDPQRKSAGFPAFVSCSRDDVIHRDVRSNEAFGKQDCWWINHAVDLWAGRQAALKAAQTELELRGVRLPAVMVDVGFHKADANRFLTAMYYFNPESDGIRSQALPWQQSEWHRARISQHPEHVAYMKKLLAWAGTWSQIFRVST